MKNSLPKIFVISLKSSGERREYIQELMNLYMLEYEFIDAVNGYQIPTTELNRFYSPELTEKYIGRSLSEGEIGCYISHVNVAKIIVERNLPEALIVEDDILISSDLKPFLQNRDRLPKDWEIVHLCRSVRIPNYGVRGWYRKSWQIYKNYEVGIPYGVLWGTQGYLIRHSLAEKLIKCAYPMFGPIDGRLFDIAYSISKFYALNSSKLIGHKELECSKSEFDSIIDSETDRFSKQLKSSQLTSDINKDKKSRRNYLFFFLMNALPAILFRVYFRTLVYFFQPQKHMGFPNMEFIDGISSRGNITKFMYLLYLSRKKGGGGNTGVL